MPDLSLLELTRQCCDAGSYLDMGRLCAESGQCWHAYRPGGTLYWFSIPYRMGWNANALVLMNILIMALSSVLAALALQRLLPTAHSRWLSYPCLLLYSLLLHALVCYPTLFNSLIDTPAAAMALIGCWFLLLGATRRHMGWLAAAGLALGLAAWMRAFYLYPLLLAVTAACLAGLLIRGERSRCLLLLVCLLPIAFQFYSTHQQRQSWSFLDQDSTNWWTEGHLVNNFRSYDTLLPKSFAYDIGYCGHTYQSPQMALQQKQVMGLLCFMAERSQFYLGTYAPATYLLNAHERITSWTFLLINLLGLVLALAMCWRARAVPAYARLFIAAFAALVFGQSLFLIPEQRFVMVPLLLAYHLGFAGALSLSKRGSGLP